MPRILFVSTSTTLGGAEKTLFSLATLVDPKEFPVAGVVSLKPQGCYGARLEELGFKSYTLGIKRRPALRDARTLAGIIDHECPDLVHAVMYQAIQLCRFVKRRARLPFRLVSSPRVSYRTRPFWTLLVDRALRRADDLLITESEASRRFLLGRLGYPKERVKTIYNGVDIARWPASKLERRRKRLELRLDHEDVLVGCVGRLDAQKGHSVLIDAMDRLRDSHKVRCVIIGDGPLRGRLEAQIRRLNLERSVWLLGERDDVVSWLSAFEAFVLPSLWEGLPNALLEAMAIGLPVVASDVDGVPEVVTSGHNGLLAPPRDPRALAQAIALLSEDASLRRQLGTAAHMTIAERFSLPAMISGYEAAYRDVLSLPPAR